MVLRDKTRVLKSMLRRLRCRPHPWCLLPGWEPYLRFILGRSRRCSQSPSLIGEPSQVLLILLAFEIKPFAMFRSTIRLSTSLSPKVAMRPSVDSRYRLSTHTVLGAFPCFQGSWRLPKGLPSFASRVSGRRAIRPPALTSVLEGAAVASGALKRRTCASQFWETAEITADLRWHTACF